MRSARRHPGITERRDHEGRVRYSVRARRNGRTYVGTFDSPAEALAFRAQALAAAEGRGEAPEAPKRTQPPPQPPGRATSVEDAARRLCRGMLDGTVRARDGRPYKPSVTREYEASLRLLVVPRIGAVPVSALRRGDVQRLVDEIAAQATPSHARKALTALRVALRVAERYGELDVSPCLGVRAPATAVPPRPARVLTPDEAGRILRAAELDDETFGRSFAGPLVGLLLGSGLRLGEALAVPWGDEGLDLDAGLVRVRCSLDRHHGEGGYRFVPPKSRSSRRDVPLPPAELARFRRHRLATGRPDDGELVFANADGSPLAPHGLPRALWRRLLVGTAKTPPLVELPAPLPRVHDLRHAAATFWLAAGLGFQAVAELLGHSDATLVGARYGHALPAEVAGAGEALERFWQAQNGR